MALDFQQQNQSAKIHSTPSPATLNQKHRSKSDLEKILLEQYVNRDMIHTAAVLAEQHNRNNIHINLRNEVEDYRKVRQEYRQWFPPSRLYGQGYNGYGNGFTDGPPKLIYPNAKPRLGHRKTARLRIKRKELAQQAEQIEELVPIRLEVDWDKIKLRDTFTWNLHDRTISTNLFATQLVEDLGLAIASANTIVEQVQHQVRGQLNDFYPQVYIKEDALDPELPYTAYKNEEMRILIKLNITIGPHTLEDKFEWEINNPLNSPEEFAQSMTRELSLSGEFTTAIAHCIREQCQLFTRSLYIIGHPFDGRPLEDADLISSFLPSPLPAVFRPYQQLREYGPYLYELTEADLKRSEVIYSREQRRQKRSVNRRGGPVLPDLKDRLRTVRTLVVSSVIPGAAESVEECRLYKRVSPFGRGRRSGARDEDLSDSSDSEDSAPESPVISGTARTRGMRGAATAAQQRMANLGRSETPEAIVAHHHETRTSTRRSGRDIREESLDSPSVIVKLKIGKERFKKYLRDLESKKQANLSSYPNRSLSTQNSTPTSAGPFTLGPPSTPASLAQSLKTTVTPRHGQIGRVDAPPPPVTPGQANSLPPQPPTWLTSGLSELLKSHPNDRFEGVMRYTAVNSATETPCAAPQSGQYVDGIKWMYLPRIRCHDCPGKLYTPGPEATVGNFEVHLKNRQHRERVDLRITGGQNRGAAGNGF
ncbi:SWI/SNF chromatin-remodeling complex subunit snf5 [Golovinomyces cichoracearum]|uniref:SWI/SNF chromatin-remodeling complex subunit snf5 n=1 Tax=Golovinomyces cichoracearum TaxID=62708 RepID=A0A420HAD8_9PEZI|nr:SWI/SNF chromatin-remodeling complex subunit snf5 [Golovinomyces cichoracearum]